MFLYFDNRAAHDMTLLFHLADVRLRHNVNQAVGVRVHLDQKKFKKFEEIINGEDMVKTFWTSWRKQGATLRVPRHARS